MGLLNIDPKKRVEIMLRGIAQNYSTAADAIRDGDEAKMLNWLKCALGCQEPLIRSIEMLHPEQKSIQERLKNDTEN